MVDPSRLAQTYREKAARCRRLARQTTDRQIAQRLLELADQFEQFAVEAEKEER
jgi:hypothetical protein